MKIEFEILDEEKELENGNFTYFFASEMKILITDNTSRIVFNTTMHKTWRLPIGRNDRENAYNKAIRIFGD